jgi:hypothetical protein
VVTGFRYSAGSFTDLMFPGAAGTLPSDVDAGRIVGNYDTLSTSHGFILDGSNWATIDHPQGQPLGTFVNGISGSSIVGNYLGASNGSSHGFVYDGVRFTPIDFPGATDTSVNGIDGLRAVGSYVNATGTHGFVAIIPEPAWAGLAAGVLVALRRPRRRAWKASR